jgi:hypothetical protein
LLTAAKHSAAYDEDGDEEEMNPHEYLKLRLLFDWVPSGFVCHLSRKAPNGVRPNLEVLASRTAKVEGVVRQLAWVYGLAVTELRLDPDYIDGTLEDLTLADVRSEIDMDTDAVAKLTREYGITVWARRPDGEGGRTGAWADQTHEHEYECLSDESESDDE